MDLDISRLLEHWDFQPGQVLVRRFRGKDGKDRVQLRVDLGILQMNAEGRPDGKRPFGYPSLFEFHQSRLYKHVAANGGSDAGFRLKPDECARIQLEAMQYHQRCFCLFQLEDFAGVIRDAERNLAVFEFVVKHAETEELSQALRQFEPQLVMVLTRARAAEVLQASDHEMAIRYVEEGMERIREYYQQCERPEGMEHSGELTALGEWLEELQAKRPLSPRERLEQALTDAVKSEDYEKAAKVRDELRKLPE